MSNAASFKILGFDVDVQQSFLFLMGIYLLMGLRNNDPLWSIASFMAVVFVSIVIHELGHATMARSLKIPVYEVALHGFGGHVRHGRSKPQNNLLVSLAGPGIELVVGIPVLLLYWYGPISQPILRTVMFQWVFVNVAWALVNLLPMRPLDGGNALASFLEMRGRGPTSAAKITSVVGMVVAALFALVGLMLQQMFLPLMGAYVAWINYQSWQRLST